MSYTEDEVIIFENGIFGFEEQKRYLLIRFEADNAGILCLQNLEDPQLAFIAANPFVFLPDYAPEVTEADLKKLGNPSAECLVFYTLCVLAEDMADSTTNLRCPLVMNGENKNRVPFAGLRMLISGILVFCGALLYMPQCSVVRTLPLVLIFSVFAHPIAALFFPTGNDGEALQWAVRYAVVYLPLTYVQLVGHFLHSYLRSLGRITTVLVISIVGSLTRWAATLWLVPMMHLEGAFLAQVIGWGADAVICVVLFLLFYQKEAHLRRIIEKIHQKT